VFMGCVSFAWIQPQLHVARDLKHVICGGRTDFIVGQQAATGIVVSLSVNDSQSDDDVEPLTWKASKDLAWDKSKNANQRVKTFAEFQREVAISLPDFNERMACSDSDVSNAAVWAVLQHALQDDTVQTCAGFDDAFCTLAGDIVRIACPDRCGCTHPRAGTYLLRGCPMQKCALESGFQDGLLTAIADPLPSVLSQRPEWRAYWHAFTLHYQALDQMSRASFPAVVANSSMVQDTAQRFIEHGCGALKQIEDRAAGTSKFFCAMDPVRRPLSAFCPRSCECDMQNEIPHSFCPLKLDEAPCPSVEVYNVTALSCDHEFPPDSGPNGWYSCVRSGYNSRNLYTRVDSADIVWTIRFETTENWDWGATFLGQHVGSGFENKWVLHGGQSGKVGSWYFWAPADDASVPRAPADTTSVSRGAAWVPRTAANTDVDCATEGMAIHAHSPLQAVDGMCVDSDRLLKPCNGGPTQNWQWEVKMGRTMIKNTWMGMCLTSTRAPNSTTGLTTKPCSGWSNQSWYYQGYYQGLLQLRSADQGSRCLERVERVLRTRSGERVVQAAHARMCASENLRQHWIF